MQRLTAHNGRILKSTPRHLDRENIDSEHINKDNSCLNLYWNRYDGEYTGKNIKTPFSQVEKRFYSDNFKDYIEDRNTRARKSGHRERETSVDKMLHNRNTMPEECIIQIGSTKNRVLKQYELFDVWRKFMHWHEETFPKIYLLDCALHLDEQYPHLHFRKVYVCEKDGIKQVGQEKCLEEMGVSMPYSNKKKDRFNNRKKTYTETVRDKLKEICAEIGFDIIQEPIPNAKHGMSKLEMIYENKKNEVKGLIKAKNQKIKEIRYIDEFNEFVKEAEEEAEKQLQRSKEK